MKKSWSNILIGSLLVIGLVTLYLIYRRMRRNTSEEKNG
jgi:hypothetical protein